MIFEPTLLSVVNNIHFLVRFLKRTKNLINLSFMILLSNF